MSSVMSPTSLSKGKSDSTNAININPNYKAKNSVPYTRVEAVVQLLEKTTISCTWEQSMRCPCVSGSSNSPKPDCPICYGQGWVFRNPYILDIAIIHDEKNFMSGSEGSFTLPGSLATPQITSNGIEDGIKAGDRITVNNWYTPQSYLFNVTQKRLNNGIFLPYDVNSIKTAYYINNDELVQINVSTAFSFEGDFLKVNDETLLGKNITLILSIVKRYYVVALNKELRYAQEERETEKEAATGNGNENIFLDYASLKSSGLNKFVEGKAVFKMPNQLLLRRENFYFPDTNIIQNETDNNLVIADPRVQDFNSFMGS